MSHPYIASVILNYNNERDVMIVVPQLVAQTRVQHTLIIVDNASDPASIATIKNWLLEFRPGAVIGTLVEILEWVSDHPEEARAYGCVYFVTHNENRGYSAGNNIGIRVAEMLNADAVLIANPDMRIDNPSYLAMLTDALFSDDACYVAASRIIGLDGKDQNPLREPSFWEELFWPRFYLSKFLKPISYVLPIASTKPTSVSKVSGSCMLLKVSFLQSIDYLDEGVFLYCEEPILAEQVRRAGANIVLVPTLSAIHAHMRSEKDSSSGRMLLFIKSRRYYIDNYSGYGRLQCRLLCVSYWLLGLLHKMKWHFETRMKRLPFI